MRPGLRIGLVGLLVVSLTLAPAVCAARPLGVVLQAEQARINSVTATSGATVFSGDALATDGAGLLRLRIGAAQIYLREASTARLMEAPNGVRADLERGIIGLSSSGDESIVVQVLGVTVRPLTTEPTHGEVALVGPRELLVTCYHGSLELTVGDGTYTVPQSTATRVLLDPERHDVEGSGAGAFQRHRIIEGLTASTITAALITLILLKNAVSPSIP